MDDAVFEVENALASVRLEGLEPGREVEVVLRGVAEGRIPFSRLAEVEAAILAREPLDRFVPVSA